MTGDDSDVQSVLDALADPDCRRLLAALDDPLTAQEAAERCDLPQTSTYRKLEKLREADLVDEETEIRADGHHATRYVRDFSGVFVGFDGEESFEVDVLGESRSPDERLADLWGRVSDEL